MQDLHDASSTIETEAANDTQGTSIGLTCRQRSYSISTKMKVLAKYKTEDMLINFAPLLL